LDYYTKVQISESELSSEIEKLVAHIKDKSWITNLINYKRESYDTRARETISKIVDVLCDASKSNQVCEKSGEYVVSVKALKVLSNDWNHNEIPLAELFKEQISGNPGFDFFSICPSKNLYMGEAKFSSSKNAYPLALDQISTFIQEEKDIKQLVDLDDFVEDKTTLATFSTKKCFVAAFSVNGSPRPERMESKRNEIINHVNVHDVIPPTN
jgi:hypothetical protein